MSKLQNPRPAPVADPQLLQIFTELGIPADYPLTRGINPFKQVALGDLEVIDIDFEGKPFILTGPAGQKFRELRAAALADSVIIEPFSGFRSYKYQRGLIKRHLDNGRPLDDILKNLAAPGYSEHHTGRAVDLTTQGCEPLGEAFEGTDAFRWLAANAGRFGYVMSFPRGNPHGFVFEPWHWCFHE